LEQIAYNDVGIIQEENIVISLNHEQKICREIVEFVVEQKSAELYYVSLGVEYSNVRTCIEGTFFEYMDLK
jgi:hypothetical protein